MSLFLNLYVCAIPEHISFASIFFFPRRVSWLCVADLTSSLFLREPIFLSSANLISNDFCLFSFFSPTRFLKGPKCNLCRSPSVTLWYGHRGLFTITFWNLSVSQLLIHLKLRLLYWFYIIWIPWSKYYVVLSQMPYRNLSILHYHYYYNESDLEPHQKR